MSGIIPHGKNYHRVGVHVVHPAGIGAEVAAGVLVEDFGYKALRSFAPPGPFDSAEGRLRRAPVPTRSLFG